MRPVLRELTGSLVSAALLGVVALVIYWRVKKDVADNVPSVAAVASGVKGIIVGAPSALVGIARGESAATYITREQQRERAEAALAAKRSLGGL